ncbi:MAG: DNA-binding protein WhiA [Parasporobacterium sp.]|nr:DNA-binding protein WhiA [Parasporobacterium sp.]
MSFSQDVKKELIGRYTKAIHCQKAELCALLLFDEKNVEADSVRNCCNYNFTSAVKTFNINSVYEKDPVKRTEKICCKRAFLRGAFLGAGTISDPEKEYRFDILCSSGELAAFLKDLFAEFGIQAKITTRRGKKVLYLKDAEQIVEALNVMEAHKAMMQYENVRILKEMRGSINRQVNCETANISKAVSAGMRQMKDIELIRDTIGLEKLDDNLTAAARARIENPEATLEELGNLMSPALSKSAVNHRMRKLSQIAKALKNETREEP